MTHQHDLLSPKGYAFLSKEVKAAVCNGAGAKDDWKSQFIPEKLLGLNCTECFNIHDYMYYIGTSPEDKCYADMTLLINLVRTINNRGGILSFPRRFFAITYYDFVYDFGHAAFYKQKEKLNVHV